MNISKATYEQLVALVFEELGPEETAEVQAALAADPGAAATVKRLRAIRELGATASPVEGPSDKAIRQAKAIFQPAARPSRIETLAARALGVVDAVIAELAFDSRLQPLAVRDVADTDQFQLSYELDDADLDLRIERPSNDECSAAGRQHRITGHYSADEGVGEALISVIRTDVEAAEDATVTVEATTDQSGCFTLELDRGSYVMHLKLPNGEVLVPEFTLE